MLVEAELFSMMDLKTAGGIYGTNLVSPKDLKFPQF